MCLDVLGAWFSSGSVVWCLLNVASTWFTLRMMVIFRTIIVLDPTVSWFDLCVLVAGLSFFCLDYIFYGLGLGRSHQWIQGGVGYEENSDI